MTYFVETGVVMSISAEFQERLRDLVEETGLNKTKIAKEMGVDYRAF